MARIRSIKPEFFRHEGLYDLERETGLPLRVAFAGLWTACDKAGRFVWKPRSLKLDCLPHDDVDFSRVLDALATRGFVRKYTVGGVDYGCVPSWSDHQVPNNKEKESEIPQPPESDGKSTPLTRGERVDDASGTPLGKDRVEREGEQGKEGKGDGSAAGAPATKGEGLFGDDPDRKTKIARPLPEGWKPTEKLELWAKEKHPLVDVSVETERFKNHAAMAGRTGKDWDAAWRNWIIKADEFRLENLKKQRGGAAIASTGGVNWHERFTEFRKDGFWPTSWGAKPNEPGCIAPKAILQQYGYGQGEAA